MWFKDERLSCLKTLAVPLLPVGISSSLSPLFFLNFICIFFATLLLLSFLASDLYFTILLI